MTDKKTSSNEQKGRISIDLGRQGKVIIGYIAVFFGYYGIICNIVMINDYGKWFSFVNLDPRVLFWTFFTYLETFFLPVVFLFGITFVLTYKEKIPQYGIKHSIWLTPLLVAQGFLFYFIMFGFSLEPFILQFVSGYGYLNIFLLFIITLSGAILGMRVKYYKLSKKRKSE